MRQPVGALAIDGSPALSSQHRDQPRRNAVNGMRARIQAPGAGLVLAFAVGCVVAGPVADPHRSRF
jgi:hypothetical protein